MTFFLVRMYGIVQKIYKREVSQCATGFSYLSQTVAVADVQSDLQPV